MPKKNYKIQKCQKNITKYQNTKKITKYQKYKKNVLRNTLVLIACIILYVHVPSLSAGGGEGGKGLGGPCSNKFAF